jgi:twitching motility two-component system response regulator PilG
MSAVNEALRHGIAAARARQFGRARPLLEAAVRESPGDVIGWFWLAIASPSVGAAIECLRRVLEIAPSHEQARAALAKLLMREGSAHATAGNRAAARALVAEASQLTPGDQAVWLALAALTDDVDGRLSALRQAAAITPDDPNVRARLRQALLARGVAFLYTDRLVARACFREAVSLDPDDPRVWQALANLADSPAESIEALRQMIRIAPGHSKSLIALRGALAEDARRLAASGLIDEACERWREATTLAGGNVETWLGLAAATSNPEEAASAIDAAYQLNPTDERVVAAMEQLRGPQVDQAGEAPVDAFAHFDSQTDAFPSFERADDLLAEIDSQLAAAAPSAVDPEPTAAAIVPVLQPAPVVTASQPPTASVAVPVPTEVPAEIPSGTQSPIAAASSVGQEAVPASAAVVVEVPARSTAAPAAPSNGSSRRTVMIVDDSPTIRKIVGLTLERAGYKVVAEPDGESAIERLVHVVPDLILLDIAMPKLDGYDVCKRIKQDPRTADVPVVMLSGKGAYFDKAKGHMAGATAYMTKPFETPAVLAVVKTHCPLLAEIANG